MLKELQIVMIRGIVLVLAVILAGASFLAAWSSWDALEATLLRTPVGAGDLFFPFVGACGSVGLLLGSGIAATAAFRIELDDL